MLKKICLLILVLALAGCEPTIIDDKTGNQQKYEAYYQSILDNETFLTESKYFSISTVMNKLDDLYRYSVIVDEPQIAMYAIEMMAIIDDGSVSINQEMVMPASGIFDRAYSLIPFQTNKEAGYAKGIVVDGLCSNPQIEVLVMVAWKNEDLTSSYKQFFRLKVSLNENSEEKNKDE